MGNKKEKSDGVQIKAYREIKGLTQAQMAIVVFGVEPPNEPTPSQIRIVGNIERGERTISDDERQRLIEAYPELAITTPPLPPGPYWHPSVFLQAQQVILTENPDAYSIWILNGLSDMMMESAAYKESWITNIRSGINYSVILDIDQMGGETDETNRLRRFMTRAADIVGDTELNEQKGCAAGVDIYCFHRRFPRGTLQAETSYALRTIKEIQSAVTRNQNRFIRLHATFCTDDLTDEIEQQKDSWPSIMEEKRAALSLFQYFWFWHTATIVYHPKPGVLALPVAAIQIVADENFGGYHLGRQHMILDYKTAGRISWAITAFEKWYPGWEQKQQATEFTR